MCVRSKDMFSDDELKLKYVDTLWRVEHENMFVQLRIWRIVPPPDNPVVTLSLGSTLNPHDIKEGDDVYFECNVRANPREHRISWFHDVSIQNQERQD